MTNLQLSPAEAAQELIERRKARRRLQEFTTYTKPDYEVNWHHEVLCDYVDRFVSGEIKRLMVFMPPRHGKSEVVSRRLPAYILGRNPDAGIIACSYGADLASRMNRDVQRIIDSEDYRALFPDTQLFGSNVRTMANGAFLRNSDIFEVVGHRGYYRSAGVGGGITGMGCQYGIIDDPVKNREEANSLTYRNALWDWYTSTFYTRLEKDGAILITLTRWHEDDLAGRLLELAAADPAADQWTVIRFPGTGEPEDAIMEDKRNAGEPLWENKFNAEALAKIKVAVGNYQWTGLYQQRPSPVEGAIWKREHWRYYDTPPRCYFILQAWDTAFKEKDSADRSACSTWGIAEHGIYLLDVWAGRLEFPQLVEMAKRQYERIKPSPNVVVVEDHASGQSLIQVLRQETKLPIVGRKMESSKEVRAWAVVGLAEAGRLFLPANAPWLGEYLAEMESFPHGKFDDQVDSTTLALNYLRGMVGDRLTAGSDADRAELDPTLEEDYAKKQARQTLEFGRGSDMAPYRASRWGKMRSKR